MKKRVIRKAWSSICIATLVISLGGCQNILPEGKQGAALPADSAEENTEKLMESEDRITSLETDRTAISLFEDETYKLQVTVDREDAVYRLQYTSLDEDVCTVMPDGTIEGRSKGKSTVIVEDIFSGVKARVLVLVDEMILPEQITPSENEVKIGVEETIRVNVTVTPEDTTDKNLIWESSNEEIATVTENGQITGVSKGECKITVKAQADERIQAEITVEVTEEKQGVEETNNTNRNTNGNASGNSTTESTTEAVANSYYMDSYAEQVLTIVNERRAEQGLAPLTMNYTLVSAAKVRAAEITQSFSHTRPNGTSCFTAFSEAGVSYWGAGENIAGGQGSPESVMNSWMNSEGHRANIMNSDFTQIGIACYYDPNSPYKYYWVQCFIY
ncbi:MAG: Ig-like domain-containing protein [Lachnospiraceae bacterium]|nr:Ig-like domain-containing protein [Lachnospiraceae bacterium]